MRHTKGFKRKSRHTGKIIYFSKISWKTSLFDERRLNEEWFSRAADTSIQFNAIKALCMCDAGGCFLKSQIQNRCLWSGKYSIQTMSIIIINLPWQCKHTAEHTVNTHFIIAPILVSLCKWSASIDSSTCRQTPLHVLYESDVRI